MACSDRMLGKFATRVVYNSDFVNTNLFDNLYIKKLKCLCNNVKENVPFSDVVKINVSPGYTSTSVTEKKHFYGSK